ncbi:MAG: 3-phosphoshikimate 1-carboxyvinyltransferase [Desulfuromonadales bacterium]|nr:3-phosphoshikimate 1-carboxyvinyltransferase [Desulfuromonadales bacterium]
MTKSREISATGGLRGEITVPGDKSISHRSIMIGAMAAGKTRVQGFLRGEDNLSTLNAFRLMGVEIEECENGEIIIHGRGLKGLEEPLDVIDCGNSGTTMRLMTGLLAAQPFFSVLTGDKYLRRRPMKRVVGPLTEMGARIFGREGGDKAPLAIVGGGLHSLSYHSPIASAQVKSSLLLAGLFCDGETTVYEPHLSRDHSERMLSYFGAEIKPFSGGVTIVGHPRLEARDILVPGDISSAAFLLVAALIVPGSELLVRNVGMNPTRSGIVDILQQMGGSICILNAREAAGEPVADLLVKSSDLHGIEIGGELVPRAIDELPVVSVAAAFAQGTTLIRDAHELRVKETDRIASMTAELTRLGARVTALDDGMRIHGGDALAGGAVRSHGDHRVAMSMAVAALAATGPVTIDDIGCTATSFPDFWTLLDTCRSER